MMPAHRIKSSVLFQALLSGIIAFMLYYACEAAYWTGGYTYFDDYFFYGLILHMPFWALGIVFAGMVLKIRIPRKITFMLEGLLFTMLLAPLAFSSLKGNFRYVFLPFGIVDFLLCLSLFSLFRRKFKKSEDKY